MSKKRKYNDTSFIKGDTNRPQRQCAKCNRCEYMGTDPSKHNFKFINPHKPKAYVNIFCKECLANHTADQLYPYALKHYKRTSGDKYAPDKSKGNINSPWRRKSKHPASR